MLINNITSRLRFQPAAISATRESERQRIKDATRRLRTHAGKIAWHLAEMASQSAPPPGR
jgi:protein subunit release factor B